MSAEDNITVQLLIAGELAGRATRLDVDVLERFLESKPQEFRYEATCRAAIAFRRAIDQAMRGEAS
jgi:hypothetical protein